VALPRRPQCIRLRLVPPLRPAVPRLPELRLVVPDRVVLRVVPWRDAAVFVLRLAVALLPLERGAAFFAVRLVLPFAALARVVRVEPAALVREAAAFVRDAAGLARVPVAAFRVVLAVLRLRVPLAALARVVLAVLRDAVFVPAAGFRVVLAEAAFLRVPALLRPPFAAAAVRPAAPRAELALALRVPDAARVRVPLLADLLLPAALPALADLRLAGLLPLADLLRVVVLRRAGARRRRGCSSVGCWALSFAVSSDIAGVCSVSSLMR
jgi:hypothetical protein